MKKGAGGNSGAFLFIWQAFIVAVLQKNTHIVVAILHHSSRQAIDRIAGQGYTREFSILSPAWLKRSLVCNSRILPRLLPPWLSRAAR
jgi:hypothetical protein